MTAAFRAGAGWGGTLAVVFVSAFALNAAAAEQARLPDDVFVASSALTALPDDVFAAVTDDEVLDVVVFGQDRVAFVRFRLKYDGKGYRSGWYDSALRLYLYLDLNHDGMVTAAEAGRAPWTQILNGPFSGNNNQQISKPGSYDPNRDGKVTFDEFVTYLRNSWDHNPVSTQNGPAPDARTDAVFALLDHDGDNSLSAKELASTDACVSVRDLDEDELISQTELTPEASPLANQFGNQVNAAVDPAAIAAVAMTSDAVRASTAQRIMKAYGKAAAAKAEPSLPPSAFAAPASAFQAADANGDGRLSLDELKTGYLPRISPSVEVVFNPGKPNQPVGKVELVTPTEAASIPGLAAKASDTGVVITLDAFEVELRGNDINQNIPNFYLQQFKNADVDKNGYVEAKESRGNFFLQQLFMVADRDGNGKLTETELNAYAERVKDATMNRTNLVVSDRGADLFQKLDSNGDNQLSIRELRKSREKLAPMDRNEDGLVAHGELPRRFELSLGRGSAQNRFQVVNRQSRMNQRTASVDGVVPAWFAGMDRNGDGDVSPREFLGPMAVFREFDRDGDGLIDSAEAAKIPNP